MILKTEETRVWRTYTGGAALDAWHGREGQDGHFPEDWAASTTRAINVGREDIVEGLSRVLSLDGAPYLADVVAADPESFFGKAHLAAFGAQAGFLIKLIDATERLAIQVHPDKEYAKTILNSDYGKTESWYILGSNGSEEEPCIYLGFKPGVTRETWKDIFDRQDIPAMLDCMHRFPVKPGECWFISAGVPHAIGRGCFLAEAQEPTDYTMRTERVTPGGLHIADKQCHMGVGFETMLDCFHYDGVSREETEKKWRSEPLRVDTQPGGVLDSLIDMRQTELFSMLRATITGEMTFPAAGSMRIMMVLSGKGEICLSDERIPFARGDVFVTRADCPSILVSADEPSELLLSYPPKP